MIRRRSNVVTFRLDPDLRLLLDEAAKRKGVTVSDLLQTVVEQLVRPSDPDPFEQTASIPTRMLEVESWYGLTVIQSSQTLAPFGIQTVLDLATPDKLLAGLEHEQLTDFARTYEVNPEWLLTGKGYRHQRTHSGWYSYDIARRIKELWVAGQLRGVRFVANRSEPSLDDPTPVILVAERSHPHPDLRHHYGVFESWPSLHWEGGNASLFEVLRFCLSLFKRSHSLAVYPSGVTLSAEAFEGLNRGTLHLTQALKLTRPAWHPEIAYRNLKSNKTLSRQVREELEHAEAWPHHDDLVKEALSEKYAAFNVTQIPDDPTLN